LIAEKPFANMLAYLLFNDMALLTIAAAFLMFVGILGAIILTIKGPLNTRVSPARVRFSIKEVLEKKY
jgi:hypothetical protein